MIYSNGDFYKGVWKNDMKNGLGTGFWVKSLNNYYGYWLNDKLHGSG